MGADMEETMVRANYCALPAAGGQCYYPHNKYIVGNDHDQKVQNC